MWLHACLFIYCILLQNSLKADVQSMFSNVVTRKDVAWVAMKNYDAHLTALSLLKKLKELFPFARNANNLCAYHVLMKNILHSL